MKRLPWVLCFVLAGLLVADHRGSTLSWVAGYAAGLEDAATSAHWLSQNTPRPLVGAYLRWSAP